MTHPFEIELHTELPATPEQVWDPNRWWNMSVTFGPVVEGVDRVRGVNREALIVGPEDLAVTQPQTRPRPPDGGG